MDGTSKEFEMTIPRIFIQWQLCLEDQVKVDIGPEYAIQAVQVTPKKLLQATLTGATADLCLYIRQLSY